MSKAADATEALVRDWVTRAVVGHDLCPFARSALPGLKVLVSSGDLEGLLQILVDESLSLTRLPVQQPATTLIAAPDLIVFEDYLDIVAATEDLLASAGLTGEVQVATFHPDYLFEGLHPDDPANFTNRAPVPVFHLLRESDVTRAVAAHPDPSAIPERNIDYLRSLGAEAARHLTWGAPDLP